MHLILVDKDAVESLTSSSASPYRHYYRHIPTETSIGSNEPIEKWVGMVVEASIGAKDIDARDVDDPSLAGLRQTKITLHRVVDKRGP